MFYSFHVLLGGSGFCKTLGCQGQIEQQQGPRQAQLDGLDIDRVFEVFGVSVGQDRRQTGHGHLENDIQCAQQLPAWATFISCKIQTSVGLRGIT